MEKAPENPLAILEILDAQDVIVGTLELSRTEDGLWHSTVAADAAYVAIVDRILKSLEASATSADYPNHLVVSLDKEGYKARARSQRITSFVHYDLRKGDVVGEVTPIFQTTDIDPTAKRILQHVNDAIRGVAGARLTQLREQIAVNEATALGNANVDSYTHEQKNTLLETYRQAHLSNFDRDDRFGALRRRLALATDLRDYALASSDAQELLRDYSSELSQEDTVAFETVPGIYAALQGRPESAIVRFQRLLDTPHVSADQRGWLWRNLSLTLKLEDPMAVVAARHSIDAFLEAGEKIHAGGSLMRLHACLAVSDPTKADEPLTELITLFPGADVFARDHRAAALHERAQWRYSCGDAPKAFADVKSAISLRRSLVGRDSRFATSLFLAAMIAKSLGSTEAEAFEAEGTALAAAVNSKLHDLRNRAIELLSSYEAEEAVRLEAEAQARGYYDLAATATIARANHDSTLSIDERVTLLEGLLAWPSDRLDMELRHVVQGVLADLLYKSGYGARAIPIYKILAEATPIDSNRFATYLNALWSAGHWGDAATCVAARIRMFGETPNLQYAYGRSLYMAGDASSAIGPLRAAQKAAPAGSHLHKFASDLLDKALDTGAVPRPINTAQSTPITLSDVAQLLEDFRQTVSHNRGDYWRSGTWIKDPERQAELALHMFIKARFGDRVMAFRQLRASGGVVDIFAHFVGIAIVFELKMCGHGYSSSYASEGEDQLKYYMPGLSNIGFLVVLDARLEDYGKSLLTSENNGELTVREVIVDVRPRETKRSGKAAPKNSGGTKAAHDKSIGKQTSSKKPTKMKTSQGSI